MRRIAILLSIALLIFGCDSDPEESTSPDEEPVEAVAEEEGDETEDTDDTDHHGEDEEHELAEDLAPGESRHFGEPFQSEEDPLPLADAIAQLEDDDEEKLESVKVSSRVEYVCEKRGCWASLDDEAVDKTVRVRMKDYGFFLPRNGGGADAVIEGSLQQVTTTEEEAKHYAAHITEQTGEEPDDLEIEGDQQTYEFMATGVAMTAPDS